MKHIYKVIQSMIFLLILGLFFTQHSSGQVCNDSTPQEFERLESIFDIYRVQPSMAPRTYVKVGYQSLRLPYIFDATNLGNFLIVKSGNPVSAKLKAEKFDIFKDNKYLIFDASKNGLKKTDKVNVGLCLKKKVGNTEIAVVLWDTNNPNEVDAAGNVAAKRLELSVPQRLSTITVVPDVAPNQELIDGTKRTTGQLKFKVDIPSLVKNNNVARFYFNTDNVISTNWKDKSSKVEMKLGAETNLFRTKWFVPINFETKANGDQRLKNATFIASSGIKTILPWSWTRKGLFNSLVKAPISPEFGISAEYYHRIKQDAASLKKFPRKDSFALVGQFTWLPIQLFTPSCEKRDGNGNFETDSAGNIVEDFDTCFSAQRISLELSGKGWWFPYEKTLTGAKVKRFEGRGEISLLIPITGSLLNRFPFTKSENPLLVNATQRIRIKYVVGANDANGFKRASQLTFGIELIPK